VHLVGFIMRSEIKVERVLLFLGAVTLPSRQSSRRFILALSLRPHQKV